MKTQTNHKMAVTEEMISARAYQLYADRGGEQGHDVEDWLAAEQELRAGVVARPAETNVVQPTAQPTPRVLATAKATSARP